VTMSSIIDLEECFILQEYSGVWADCI